MKKPSSKKDFSRLSTSIVPRRYRIRLKPDLQAHIFSGEVDISIELQKATREITLHCKELDIATAHVEIGKAGLRRQEKIFAKNISYDEKAETATFLFDKQIPPGKAMLGANFSGVLKDNLRGFYRSTFVHEGKERVIATTQFEATDARRAFPCFDEPAQKAIFDVELVIAEDKTAISNTLPFETLKHEGGYKLMRFMPTPKMSTYLLAFIIGDFEHLEGRTKRGVQVRVFTTAGKKEQGRFALDCAIRTLDFYEKYFAIKYPLPVLDMIAIPDFASGAMENWGAVTYRETALLVDPEQSSLRTKQWVALVVAHELAHQWFGNLVTMEWWTHLWLNEGFASYIEYLAVDELFPEWDIWTQFVTMDLGAALRLDALATTHPIEVEVHHPSEISEIFDEVSYSKGASIIRMLADYLGPNSFRDGLRHYLKKHSYQNASTEHLWEAFEHISGKEVVKMMAVWTSKAGYPVLSVSKKGDTLFLTQERFFANPKSKARVKDKTVWKAPVSILLGTEQKTKRFLLDKARASELVAPAPWHKLNADEVGVYRVAYDSALLEKLVLPVMEQNISSEDRLGLIRDLFALAEAGTSGTLSALEFLPAYERETNYTVWVEITSGLMRVRNLLEDKNTRKVYDAFVIEMMQEVKKFVGYVPEKEESHTKALLRTMVLSTLGILGDKETVAWAQKLWKKPAVIAGDMRSTVYAIIASHGGEKEFNTLSKMYQKATMHEEKNRLGSSLGEFENTKLLAKALEFSLSKNVRNQDAPSIVASVFANSRGRALAWKFLKKNWKTMLTRYGEGGMMLSRVLRPAGAFTDMETAKDIKAFFKKNLAPGAERTITQVVERIETNSLWKKRDAKKVERFLLK